MAIEEFRSRHVRKQVACLGDEPSAGDKHWFPELRIEECGDTKLKQRDFLSSCMAAVFTQRAEKPLRIVHDIEEHAKLLLDFGCRIIVRLAKYGRPSVLNCINTNKLPPSGLSLDEYSRLGEWWPRRHEGSSPLPHVHVYNETVEWRDVLRQIADHPAGNTPASNLVIDVTDEDGKEISLKDDSETLLIQRAFWDCTKLHLIRSDDGRSDDSVYRAYAEPTEIKGGHRRPWPVPYFVKIGGRYTIIDEHKIYEESVRPYIPFHLGPRLAAERCCLGVDKGVIVGDYVQESESLRDCASAGRAATAIACLFDRTLHGWYRDAGESNSTIASHILGFFPTEISDERRKRAEELGATGLNLDELRTLFTEHCTSTPVLSGPIHGDLHPGNVLVRGADAIVIDFLKHGRNMPLVYDAASLEAGLLVDGFGKDNREGSVWMKSIESLYADILNPDASLYIHPKDSSYWFYECVRRIRSYAFQMERSKGQYAAALAVALLRKGCKDLKFQEPKATHRAGAVVLAQRILFTIKAPS